MRRFVLIIAAVVGAAIAQAETQGTIIWNASGGVEGTTLEAAKSAALAEWDSLTCTPFNKGAAYFPNGTGYEGINGNNQHVWEGTTRCGDGTFNQAAKFLMDVGGECLAGETFNTATGDCDAPQVCAVEGLSFIKSGTGTAPATFCSLGCTFNADGPSISMGGGWAGSYTASGACSPDVSPEPATGLNCLSTGTVQYCVDPGASENCGTINGEYVCLENVPQGNCMFLAGGSAVCTDGSQTDPPDETFTDGDGNTYDIYTDGQTGGTSGGNGTSAGTDNTTGAGSGASSGGTGDGDGEGDCDGANCQGELPGDNENVDDFGTLFSNFYGRVEGSPIISSFSGLPGSVGAGSCEGFSSDPIAALDGTTLTIDAHCTLWPEVLPLLQTFMMAVWALIGGIIILRA